MPVIAAIIRMTEEGLIVYGDPDTVVVFLDETSDTPNAYLSPGDQANLGGSLAPDADDICMEVEVAQANEVPEVIGRIAGAWVTVETGVDPQPTLPGLS